MPLELTGDLDGVNCVGKPGSVDHCMCTEGSSKFVYTDCLLPLFALTLRGPSGGHCVGLSGRTRALHAGALRAPSVWRASAIPPFPPKLHAVAPGGPPEGQCEKEQHGGRDGL